MERPERRWTLDISISGDEWLDVVQNLLELVEHIASHGPGCSSVSGGYSSGHTVHVIHNPEMTHEKYAQLLEAWLAEREK